MKASSKRVSVSVEGTIDEEFSPPLTFTPQSPESPSSKMEKSFLMEVGQNVPRSEGTSIGPPEVRETISDKGMLATLLKNQEKILDLLVTLLAREAYRDSESDVKKQAPVKVQTIPYTSNSRAKTILLTGKRPLSPVAGASGEQKRPKGSSAARGTVNF